MEVIRDVCADEIAEYIKLDAERDARFLVHSIVSYTGGTAFAWYGMNPYPRLKRVVLGKPAAGGVRRLRRRSCCVSARPKLTTWAIIDM